MLTVKTVFIPRRLFMKSSYTEYPESLHYCMLVVHTDRRAKLSNELLMYLLRRINKKKSTGKSLLVSMSFRV